MKRLKELMETPVTLSTMLFLPLIMILGIVIGYLWLDLLGLIISIIISLTWIYVIFEEE